MEPDRRELDPDRLDDGPLVDVVAQPRQGPTGEPVDVDRDDRTAASGDRQEGPGDVEETVEREAVTDFGTDPKAGKVDRVKAGRAEPRGVEGSDKRGDTPEPVVAVTGNQDRGVRLDGEGGRDLLPPAAERGPGPPATGEIVRVPMSGPLDRQSKGELRDVLVESCRGHRAGSCWSRLRSPRRGGSKGPQSRAGVE